jgi:pre-mRNA-processing factor 8
MRIELNSTSASLNERKKTFLKTTKNRYKNRLDLVSQTISKLTQIKQPPESLRKIIKEHGDMSSARYRAEISIHTGALKHLPRAIFKIFENIPQPYELTRYVNVVYHTSGAITFIEDSPKVIPQVFIAQWAATWQRMRQEKLARARFQRVPARFDKEEPFVDFGDNLQLIPNGSQAVELDIDQIEDQHVFDWFYESHQPLKNNPDIVNGASYRSYSLSVPIMSNLYRLARPFLFNHNGQHYSSDPNLTYLFNRDAFLTAKSLSLAVPCGPSFEPLYPEEENDNWTEFNDIYKLITRRPLATDYRIALPYVYNKNPRSIAPQVSQYPLSCAVLEGDNISINETPAYAVESYFFPIKHSNNQIGYKCLHEVRSIARTKLEYNIYFLQAFRHYQNTTQLEYLIEKVNEMIKNDNQSVYLTKLRQRLITIKDRLIHPDQPNEIPLAQMQLYGDFFYEHQTPSFSRYYSHDDTIYPHEYVLTTAYNSPYYNLDEVSIKDVNQKTDLNYYTYPAGDKMLWQEDVLTNDDLLFPHNFLSFGDDNDDNDDDDNHDDDTNLDLHFLSNTSPHEISHIITDSDFNLIPMFDDFPLYSQTSEANTLAGLILYHAPAPFSRNHGTTVPIYHMDLVKNWYIKTPIALNQPQKIKLSYQKLLKQWILSQISNHRDKSYKKFTISNRDVIKRFGQQSMFQRTRIEWLEAAIQVLRQGHNMLTFIIKRKRVEYLHLDYNFTLQTTRILTTKERKSSRFGASFHIIREILSLLKIIVDAHIRHRSGDIDSFQLADSVQTTFSHVGILTGIYQQKYSVMHQIRQCKDLKHLIYNKFNIHLQKGPGVGFWHPLWRVWLYYIQGLTPMLESWLGNLLSRLFEGRKYGERAQTITKQRVETVYDAELQKRIHADIMDMMPTELRSSKARVISQHMSEAWRCWRSGRPWKVPGMPAPIETIINQFVKSKADHWITHAYRVRERLKRGEYLEKTVVRKNLGRLTRLALKYETQRQNSYLEQGPNIDTDEASGLITMMSHWLESRNFVPIKAPAVNYKHDTKILTLSLDKLKEQYINNTTSKITTAQRQELTLVQQGHDNVDETLKRIKSMILNARSFKEIEIEYYDEYNNLTPVYTCDPMEKITDMYLDQYLWYEAYRRGLFPEWIKPSDSEPGPYLVYKTCQNINNYHEIWDNTNGSSTALVQTQFSKLFDNVDLTVLNRLLRLIMDPVLADYITARYNSKITYKDMTHVNSIGIIRGIAFSSFVTQYYGLVMDLLILGLERASQLAGPPANMNKYGQFDQCGSNHEETLIVEKSHPIRMYCRYIDKVYILFKLEGEEVTDLVQQHLAIYPDPNNDNIHTYNYKKCWPRDSRMRLLRNDVNFGKSLFYLIKNRIPPSLSTIEWNESFVSVYSRDNPQLLFDMLGFEVRLIPHERQAREYSTFSVHTATWSLQNRISKEDTSFAYVRVADKHVQGFSNQVRHMLMTSGNAPYIKIAQKWNSILTSLMTYYREAVSSTPELLELLIKCENKVQNRIKMALNSKMPQRFPPVVFYSPVELGGLGMLSMGNILVPESDRIYGKETAAAGITHFRQGMSSGEQAIPALYRYIVTWETEFLESENVWADYIAKADEARAQERRLGLADLNTILDKGVPRINTLFSKDRQTLWYDKGWRTRLEWKKYTTTFHNNYWWTNPRHDGRLWSLSNYRTDVVQALGGVESILEHTLFKATYFKTWEGVFWEKKTSFEDSLKLTRLTKAQNQGLSQVPNRRFALWWSPTINRADVYIGYMVQLDLTGIFMHGKLPVLKTAYVQIFRAHLWQKIHESVVVDLCTVLEQFKEQLQIEAVSKESIHPRKSYKMTSSSADIKVTSLHQWEYTTPTLVTTRENEMISSTAKQDTLWFDVQIRWGDYDQHDIESYTRSKYLEYTADLNNNIYPSQCGVMIGIDLTYNTWSAYGNWFPELPSVLTKAMAKIMKSNSALYILRERVRKAVQLYTSEPTEPFLSSSNYGEIFRPGAGRGQNVTWFIDSAAVYRVTRHRTTEGNYTTKPVNGALIIFNPTAGTLYLKIVHTSTWSGQKRLTQAAKWKSAEETVALIRPLPQEERPTQLIIAQQALLDPLQTMCTDYPNMVLRGSDLSLPLQSILKLSKVGDLVMQATEPRIVVFNLYDDWAQTTTQSFTCFSRLLLLLRAYHINSDRTQSILYPNATIVTKQSHLWPSYNDNEWANVETQLRDLILQDFAIKNQVQVQSLTQSETRDIILGAQITSPSQQREQLLEELDKNSKNDDLITTTNVQTLDQHGNIVITTTSSNYERSQFLSTTDWRVRYLSTQQLYKRTNNIGLRGPEEETVTLTKSGISYILPSNLFKQLVQISDVKTITMAYMYGVIPSIKGEQLENVRLIKAFMIPPQFGSNSTILYAYPPVSNPTGIVAKGNETEPNFISRFSQELISASRLNLQTVSDMIPIGLFYTIGQDDGKYLSPELFIYHNEWYDFIKNNTKTTTSDKNSQFESIHDQYIQHLPIESTITMTLSYTPGSCTLNSFRITNTGRQWYHKSPNAVVDVNGAILSTVGYNNTYFKSQEVKITENDNGYFLSTFDKVWNYHFMSLKFKKAIPFLLHVSPPIDFYHSLHRKSHFLNFVKLGQQLLTNIDQNDVNDAIKFDVQMSELDDEFF